MAKFLPSAKCRKTAGTVRRTACPGYLSPDTNVSHVSTLNASDFEHAVPYDQGGVTDACNASCRPLPPLPPGKTDVWLDGHPAETGMARMGHPDRPHLYTGTLAVHRLTAASAS